MSKSIPWELKVHRVILTQNVPIEVPSGEKWVIRRIIPRGTSVLMMKDSGKTSRFLGLAQFDASQNMSGAFGDVSYVDVLSGEQLGCLGYDWDIYYEVVK